MNGDNFCISEFIRENAQINCFIQDRGLDMSNFTNLNNFTEVLNGPIDFPFFKEMKRS